MVILALVTGLLLGALGAYFAVRPALIERRRRTDEVIALERALAGAEAELAAERAVVDERLAAAIKTLSSEALDANSARFLELADARLSGYVRPLKDSLERMDQQLQGVERIRQEAYGALRTQVTTLSERTGNLANALRAPHVRGRWGEVQLRNVVEQAGMVEHCDYVRQATTSDDERTLRPDLVVRIPGGKHVVVDAKAPLAAYLEAFETADDEMRTKHFADHARQVRDHVTKLAAKQYWRQFEPSPDFVVMFLPDESYLRAAHEHDAALAEDAWRANVILASPSTLVALLRTVAATWQQETVAESARAVHALGRELYERIGKVGDHLGKLGRSLNGTVTAYNEAVGSLETRVLVTARKLEEHGIGGELEMPAPVDRTARPLTAPELVERAPLAILAGDADAA
ncbi:MAG: DNA recombination protein RmuC [Thermoleophilia bacterium]|nr:DNA recombination protein RmuC [Thermoleophilia bacterium]MDH4340217.1 DNA recombination protein RmuC [Thermoleophilia bacterium]MDH5280447.1 DNA recombination protein RmuC [Thermoleophilia bacterium]